jgi:hypothetical protein
MRREKGELIVLLDEPDAVPDSSRPQSRGHLLVTCSALGRWMGKPSPALLKQ